MQRSTSQSKTGPPRPDKDTLQFTGQLVLDGKCLKVDSPLRVKDSTYLPISPLLIWPSAFSLSVDDGDVGIVDATGVVIARAGDKVQLSAFYVSHENAVEHGGLEEISLACGGPLWAVGEDFTAMAPDAQ